MYYNEKVEEVEALKTREEAINFVNQKQEKIPIGILYEEKRKTYEEHLPQISKKPLNKQNIENIETSDFLEKRL